MIDPEDGGEESPVEVLDAPEAEVVEATAAPVVEAPAEESAAERIARKIGWTPRGEFRGNPDNWRDAETYILHGREIQDDLRDRLDRLGRVQERIAQQQDRFVERQDRSEAEVLEARFEQAVVDGDVEAARQARQQLDARRGEARPYEPPEIAAFRAENPWFETDQAAHTLAVQVSNRLAGRPVAEQLAAVKAEVSRRFPEYFPATRHEAPKPAPQVNAPASRSTNAPTPKTLFGRLDAKEQRTASEAEKKGWGSREDIARLILEDKGETV